MLESLQIAKIYPGKMDLEKLTTPNILRIEPYSSARDEFSGKALYYLDANENAYGSAAGGNHHRYPDPYQSRLKKRISLLKEVGEERIFIGHGSDEPIDLLIRAFCRPGKDQVITLPPTYGMYGVSAGINDVKNLKIPLQKGFQPDVSEILRHSGETSKILFLCSPNNPTGNSYLQSHVMDILRTFQGLVVIDEAYIDFAKHKGYIGLLDKYPNLVILQTFSKAWGLASLRLGIAFANPLVIKVLNKIKPPYNISGTTQKLALKALTKVDLVQDRVKKILVQRDALVAQLKQCRHVLHVYPSDANFVLSKMEGARHIYEALIKRRVIVRDRSNVKLCENCLRITVGTEKENEILIEALNNI